LTVLLEELHPEAGREDLHLLVFLVVDVEDSFNCGLRDKFAGDLVIIVRD